MTYNKPLTERLLSLHHKDLLTVDLFSVYILSRVDIVIRYIKVDLKLRIPDYVNVNANFKCQTQGELAQSPEPDRARGS